MTLFFMLTGISSQSKNGHHYPYCQGPVMTLLFMLLGINSQSKNRHHYPYWQGPVLKVGP